jgi:hypothetical protein
MQKAPLAWWARRSQIRGQGGRQPKLLRQPESVASPPAKNGTRCRGVLLVKASSCLHERLAESFIGVVGHKVLNPGYTWATRLRESGCVRRSSRAVRITRNAFLLIPRTLALVWVRGGSPSASRRSFSCSKLGQSILGVHDLVRMHDVSLRHNCASSTSLLLRLEGIQNIVPTNVPVEWFVKVSLWLQH